MRRRSLFSLTGLGLLATTGLGSCSPPDPSPSPGGDSPTPTKAGKLETLRVHVPTTLAFMAPMAVFGTLGHLDDAVGEVTLDNWATVDVLKSLLISKETDLAATPSYASANLYNKGLPVRLVAITVWGMLFLLGPEGTANSGLAGLKGRRVAVPLPGNMPDLVFRYLLKNNQISADGGAEGVEIAPYEQAQDALQGLLSGQVDYAVLPEHAATVAQNQAKQNGRALDRTADLQALWAEATGTQARFPMAGVVMPAELADGNPGLIGNILTELEAAVAQVNATEATAVAAITRATEVPEPVVTSVIPRLQLEVVPGAGAKDELEDFYTRLMELSPDIVGGKLPDDAFYIADPR
ncbi:MAG: ABC transporter substrate-binding protein [Arachnia propionica]|uniref:ABC transporter substrate-binding protein n=1 Tax=Arachnia propionica TaxID=1750 RepID=UPI002708B0E3|nr:ABC transporter substrate-binding protein [Arachnia propionica]